MDDAAQPWLECEELLAKIKEMLISRAIYVLHREIEENRLKVNDPSFNSVEANNGNASDLFIINNIIAREHEIYDTYTEYIKKTEAQGLEDPNVVDSIEGLKKFMLAVSELSTLMEYAGIVNEWMVEANTDMRSKSVHETLARTMQNNQKRKEVLEFVLRYSGSKEFGLSDHELSEIELAINKGR